MGDSIASGEGNPDRRFPDGSVEWGDLKCHRSQYAGAALAARKLEKSDKHTSVTFVSVACSGASINDVVNPGYLGEVPDGVPLPSQIEETSWLLCPDGQTCNSRWEINKIDALILQVGGNDLHFDDIVTACAKERNCQDDGDLNARLAQDKANLPGRLNTMADALNAWLRYDNVVFPDYFDPTRAENGDFCPDMKFPVDWWPDGHITAVESQWAFNQILVPLNTMNMQASFDHNWSKAVQHDDKGTMHPNVKGHEVYRDRLFTALQPLTGA